MVLLRQNLIFNNGGSIARRVEEVASECTRRMNRNEKSAFKLTFYADDLGICWIVRLKNPQNEGKASFERLTWFVHNIYKTMMELREPYDMDILNINIVL